MFIPAAPHHGAKTARTPEAAPSCAESCESLNSDSTVSSNAAVLRAARTSCAGIYCVGREGLERHGAGTGQKRGSTGSSASLRAALLFSLILGKNARNGVLIFARQRKPSAEITAKMGALFLCDSVEPAARCPARGLILPPHHRLRYQPRTYTRATRRGVSGDAKKNQDVLSERPRKHKLYQREIS